MKGISSPKSGLPPVLPPKVQAPWPPPQDPELYRRGMGRPELSLTVSLLRWRALLLLWCDR